LGKTLAEQGINGRLPARRGSPPIFPFGLSAAKNKQPRYSLPGFLEGTTPAPPLSRPSPAGGFASLESRAEGGIPLEAGEDAGSGGLK